MQAFVGGRPQIKRQSCFGLISEDSKSNFNEIVTKRRFQSYQTAIK